MKQLLLSLLLVSVVFAETDTETVNVDSLREYRETVQQQIEIAERAELEQRRAALEEELKRRGELPCEPDTVVRYDTVYIQVSSPEEEELADEILAKIDATLSNGTKSGIGGSGGPSFGISTFSVRPVNEMITSDIAYRGEDSPFYGLDFGIHGNYETFYTSGGFGVAGIGDGIRVGGGGYSSEKSYKSLNTSINDTIKELTLDIGYGGVILEKAWTKENKTFTMGTLLGGGNYSTEVRSIEYGDFSEYMTSAGFFAGEFRAGATISFARWFHLGVDGYGLIMSSQSGFKFGSSFTTFNGGGRLRILFGNLG